MTEKFCKMRPIAQVDQLNNKRTIVVDSNFIMRPLLRGETTGEDKECRLFQQLHVDDYILTSYIDPRYNFPVLQITRHKEAEFIQGGLVVEILNRINPILQRYLMDYKHLKFKKEHADEPHSDKAI